jgi:hypothetical protein
LSAFELDVSVSQGTGFGSVSRLAPPVIVPCDARWHRITVSVPADVGGSFTTGSAIIDVFLGVYDPTAGDLEARDSSTVRL